MEKPRKVSIESSDDDFEVLKKSFDKEIRAMEEKAKRWEEDLLDSHGYSETIFEESESSTTRTTSSKTTYYATEDDGDLKRIWHAHLPFTITIHHDNEGLLKNATGKSGSRTRLRFTFDVQGCRRGDIKVRIVNDKLQVRAKRENMSDAKTSVQEYCREVLLPIAVDRESATSMYSKVDGTLAVDMYLKPHGKYRKVTRFNL